MLHVTAPSFLFGIRITTAGRIISAIVLALLGFHHLLKPFFHYRINGSCQISHLLVAPLLGEQLRITGRTSGCGHGIAHSVIPATFLDVVSQMGPALCLAVLAEHAGHALLWDLFTGASRGRMLLGTSLSNCGSSCSLCLCILTSLVLLIYDTFNQL